MHKAYTTTLSHIDEFFFPLKWMPILKDSRGITCLLLVHQFLKRHIHRCIGGSDGGAHRLIAFFK
jgi:hypothetical protein